MADRKQENEGSSRRESELSRRDFVALSFAAGFATATGSVSAAELPVMETNVAVKTPDGTCDATFIHPPTGSHPAVLVWPDAFGLRPAMRDIGKRIAAEGYSETPRHSISRTRPIWRGCGS
jgi:carboxymethylenebutenolidase